MPKALSGLPGFGGTSSPLAGLPGFEAPRVSGAEILANVEAEKAAALAA